MQVSPMQSVRLVPAQVCLYTSKYCWLSLPRFGQASVCNTDPGAWQTVMRQLFWSRASCVILPPVHDVLTVASVVAHADVSASAMVVVRTSVRRKTNRARAGGIEIGRASCRERV